MLRQRKMHCLDSKVWLTSIAVIALIAFIVEYIYYRDAGKTEEYREKYSNDISYINRILPGITGAKSCYWRRVQTDENPIFLGIGHAPIHIRGYMHFDRKITELLLLSYRWEQSGLTWAPPIENPFNFNIDGEWSICVDQEFAGKSSQWMGYFCVNTEKNILYFDIHR